MPAVVYHVIPGVQLMTAVRQEKIVQIDGFPEKGEEKPPVRRQIWSGQQLIVPAAAARWSNYWPMALLWT